MQTLLQDLKYGIRTLARAPGFAIVAILTLALGIGANTAIFSVVKAVLLRSLPFKNADRLVMLREDVKNHGPESIAYANFEDWEKQNQSFSKWLHTPMLNSSSTARRTLSAFTAKK